MLEFDISELDRELLRLLRQAGWFPGRNVDLEPLLLRASDFTPSPRVRSILQAFGGLEVPQLRDGTQVVSFDATIFAPDPLMCRDEWMESTGKIIGQAFFPIASNGPGSIIVDDSDRVFEDLCGGGLLHIANSFSESLNVLVLGRARPIGWVE